MADGIDKALADAVASGDVHGVVAAAASDNGVVYQGAHGVRTLGDAQPMTLDTVMRLFSMTKAITATAAMQLVEQGKLSLDGPIAEILPQLAKPQVLEGFDAAGKPILRPARTPITLRHLLTHTAGFGYENWNGDLQKYMQVTGLPGLPTGKLEALNAPLTFEPGTRWQYSISIDWAGRAVEAVGGKDLEAYFRDHIFAPLGMRDTSFRLRPDQQARRATPHARQPDGKLQTMALVRSEEPEFLGGGGGLFGTVPDYLAFVRALLANGGGLVKPETFAEMARNNMGDIDVETLKSLVPAMSLDANLFPDIPQKWGLSFSINTKPTPEGRAAGSLAWAGLGNLYFWVDPVKRVAGIWGTQILPFCDTRSVKAFKAFEKAVYDSLDALSGVGSTSPDEDPVEDNAMPAIDDVLRQGIDSGAAAGVAAAATTDSGTIYEGAFGVREVGKPASMTPDTVVWIASMTKAITGMAAMQLVEHGKLSLDEPIAKLLPQLANPQVFEGFDASGKPKLRPAKGAITLRQLLTHTAGFSYDIWNPDLGKHMEAAGIPGIISCQNAALTMPLTFDPGTRWDYGINIDWVGKAVEAASGETLDAYLRKNIFEPLGMSSTSFKLSDVQRERLSGMHARGEDGKLAAMPFEIPQEPEFHMGGGGLYGTVQDYLKLVHCLLNDGAPLVSKKTFAEMARNNIGHINVVALKTAIPPYSADADFFPGIPCKWGLSFLINTAPTPEGRSPGSLAWAGLANTFFWADPAKKIGGVFATQTLPFFDPKVIGLFRDYERAVYRSL